MVPVSFLWRKNSQQQKQTKTATSQKQKEELLEEYRLEGQELMKKLVDSSKENVDWSAVIALATALHAREQDLLASTPHPLPFCRGRRKLSNKHVAPEGATENRSLMPGGSSKGGGGRGIFRRVTEKQQQQQEAQQQQHKQPIEFYCQKIEQIYGLNTEDDASGITGISSNASADLSD